MYKSLDEFSLGAGNVPFWLRDQGADISLPRLWLDRQWIAPDGNSCSMLSLEQILRYANAYRRMYRGLGVAPRDVVTIQFKLPIDVFLHWIALAAEGAIAAAINPNLPADVATAYGHRIGAIGALKGESVAADEATVATKLWWRSLAAHNTISTEVTAPSVEAVEDPVYQYKPNDIVLLYHTSGTTGVPKAVSAGHQGFMAGIRSELRQQLSPLLGRTMLNALPAAHQSSFATITRALLTETKLILASDQSAQTLIANVDRFAPDCITSFSGTLREVARLNLNPGAFSSVGLWMTTGDVGRRDDIARVSMLGTHLVAGKEGKERVPGMYVLDCFGSSELGHVHFACLHAPGKPNAARCIGKPASFVTAAILDGDGAELPRGNVGYLAVRSDSITPGYWNDQERTDASWRNGFWITGDVGYCDEFGRYFHFDRYTDVIETSKGFIYSVRTEEQLLLSIPEIERCAVVAQPHNSKTRAICLVETRETHWSQHIWLEKINAALANAELPLISEVRIVSSGFLPVGPTGKIRKFLLREQLCAEVSISC